MKHGQRTVSAEKTAMSCARAGTVAGILLVAGLLPLPLDAAIDHKVDGSFGTRVLTGVVIDSEFPAVVAVDNSDTLEVAEAETSTMAEAPPKAPGGPAPMASPDASTPDAAKSLDEILWPAKQLGLMDRMQDWLARANREFQTTIIRRLSTPPAGGGGDDIARKLAEVKEEDTEAAADRAEEAIKAVQAKQAAEIKHQRELADAAQKAAEDVKAKEPVPAPVQQAAPKPDNSAALAEEMRKERERLEAEARRIEEERKLAEEKRKADEQKRLEELRIAAQEKLAEQKGAEAKAARQAAAEEAAAREAAAAKEKELAARQAAEAQHQRELADAAEKAAENAKRIAAREEAARAAAAKEAEEKARDIAAKEAAAKEAAAKHAAEAAEKERAAQEAVAKAAEAKKAAERQAAEKQSAMKQAMVESDDDDKTDIAEAPAAAEPSPGSEQPAAKPEEAPQGEGLKAATEPSAERAHVYRLASNHLAHEPVVKPWIRRARQGRCRYAGRKILLPGRYTVARGDTLSLISLRHYRTDRYVRRIYRANRDIIRDPNRIYPCQRLYLPRRGG